MSTTETGGGGPGSPGSPDRYRSIDVLRGAVMLLMAIDHVRVYSGLPAGGPSPGIFFTRWVTHFCAPAFVFLAGTSAFLSGRRYTDRGRLAGILALRGLWLVLLELTVIRLAWTFNLDFGSYLLAGIIWVIGLCMVALAGMIFLPTGVLAALSLTVIFGHNLVGRILFAGAGPGSDFGWITRVLYVGGPIRLGEGGPDLVVLYSLVPWVGVIGAGYVFGRIMTMEPARRDRWIYRIGAAALALFVGLRATNLYGDPRPWEPGHGLGSALSFLNTTKYPASLLFLLMTLGPTLLLIPRLERARSRPGEILEVYGRVPFFYYVLHIPLIHLATLLIATVRSPEAVGWLIGNHPMRPAPVPEGYAYGFPLLYATTLLVVAALYVPCLRWGSTRRRLPGIWRTLL